MKKIGFIGLGNMGLPMTENLIKAGYEVYGLNRSKPAEERLAALGGRVGYDRARLAAEMDLIVTCLPMPADVEEVYLAENGLVAAGKPGLILVDCSTVNPSLSRRIGEAADARGIPFLDAPVSGGTTGAAAGTLSIMVGGEEDAFKQAQPILAAMGKQIDHVGAVGSGSAVKLVNQLMVGIHTQAVSEGLALGRQVGLDEAQLVQVLLASFASSRILDRHYRNHIGPGRFEAGFAVKLLAKDLNLAAELAAQVGVGLPAGRRVRSLLQGAIREGFAEQDMSAMLNYQIHRDGQPEPVKHFAVFLPMKDPELSVKHREEHLQFLADRRSEGKLHANGRFVDGAGGLVIYKARSLDEAASWVKQDPYVVLGARGYEIHEWDIVLADEA
ncbi:NAD(P)-binding domain-containing protein [Cohnella sp. JJ-181]|uniref:NAD(P)-binding domain-containing protein n=1 Tax=Cohnella rhizoplanae TaxID=2974897 RepID=UPI0022FF501A|nr:NAD(P)-binding domain-containing protein [Cohnella sp. JJ-181]CAI6087448.1 2-hydroxy-3-oxopropionate reductase [Cohnella sp. JJ-181]